MALQFLYGHDFQDRPGDPQSLAAEIDQFIGCFDTGAKAFPYTRELVTGICEQLPEIDALLAANSLNWRLERMSFVDRNILRIAVYEMVYADGVPAKVAINEALEIAKQYSVADSVSFINGILDAIQTGKNKD